MADAKLHLIAVGRQRCTRDHVCNAIKGDQGTLITKLFLICERSVRKLWKKVLFDNILLPDCLMLVLNVEALI